MLTHIAFNTLQVEVSSSNLASGAKLRLDRLVNAEMKASRLEEQHILEGHEPWPRDGDMYSGAFGRAQDLRQKRLQEHKDLIRCNPIAFQEDSASQADERYMYVGLSQRFQPWSSHHCAYAYAQHV